MKLFTINGVKIKVLRKLHGNDLERGFAKHWLNAVKMTRGTQRQYSSKPLKYGTVERILVFER